MILHGLGHELDATRDLDLQLGLFLDVQLVTQAEVVVKTEIAQAVILGAQLVTETQVVAFHVHIEVEFVVYTQSVICSECHVISWAELVDRFFA